VCASRVDGEDPIRDLVSGLYTSCAYCCRFDWPRRLCRLCSIAVRRQDSAAVIVEPSVVPFGTMTAGCGPLFGVPALGADWMSCKASIQRSVRTRRLELNELGLHDGAKEASWCAPEIVRPTI